MKKRLLASVLASIFIIGATPIAASAEWKQNSNNQWNWLDSRNFKVISWTQINGSWYYFDNNGNMKTGWIEYAGQWYHTNGAGVMQKGWIEEEKTWHHLGDTGVMDTDKVVDGYYLGEDGIMQDIGKNKVIFEDEYAKVTYIGINRDSVLGPKIKVQIENKYNQELCIQIKDDVSVDASNKNATLNEEIIPQNKIIANFLLPSSTDKKFKNIKGKISIIQKNSWKLLKTEEFSLDF